MITYKLSLRKKVFGKCIIYIFIKTQKNQSPVLDYIYELKGK